MSAGGRSGTTSASVPNASCHSVRSSDAASTVASPCFPGYTSRWSLSGTTGILTHRESPLSQDTTKPESERKLELLLEAARRANWDALHGPRHLRTGRFFVSKTLEAHLPREARPTNGSSESGSR